MTEIFFTSLVPHWSSFSEMMVVKKKMFFLLVLQVLARVQAQEDTAKYVCVQYQNMDFSQYHLNTCRLHGEMIPKSMTGWTQTGNTWLQFDCDNCNNASLTATAPPVVLNTNVTTSNVPNDMFPCCYYSDPNQGG